MKAADVSAAASDQPSPAHGGVPSKEGSVVPATATAADAHVRAAIWRP